MNNLSYCGLVDAKKRDSDIDLPVTISLELSLQNSMKHCDLGKRKFVCLHMSSTAIQIISPKVSEQFTFVKESSFKETFNVCN